MTPRPLNQTDFSHAVAARLGVSHDAGEAAVRAVLEEIAHTVATGRDVVFTNFGTFRAATAAARKARNPQTGAVVPLPVRPVMRFRLAPRLRAVIAAGDPTASLRKRPSK